MPLFAQFFKESIDFFVQIFKNRNLIMTLSIRDFQQTYIRNLFGFVWAILDPLAFVVILYFVFGARFASKDPNGIPFGMYLLMGYIAYDFFSNSLNSVTSSIHSHSFLLKKINFKVATLPIIAILAILMMHGVVLSVTIVVLMLNHVFPTLMWLQLFYYIFALMILIISVGWLTSSIYLFFPDVRNIVAIILRILFFLTPIFWNMEGLEHKHQLILKLNPIYYIVNGYRDSFFYQKGFWEHPALTLYFWALTLIFMVIGVAVFKKLRPHFADVVA
jgi:lipopolysaccharide transport system permease protein/teichoic acid transport system permease protein